MNKSSVKADLVDSTDKLLRILSGVSDSNFNIKPVEEGWSVGQTTEHLIKVEYGTLKLFAGPVHPTDRDPEQKIQEIKERFLNFEKRMTAFGPIIPDAIPKDKSKALVKLQDIRQQLTGLIDIRDLTKTVTGFEHPLFGYLTLIEWIYFNIYHSRRHVRQIQEIVNSING